MPPAFVLLRCIGKAAVKNVVNLFTYGVGGDILVDTWEYWCEASKEEKRAADVQVLAAAPPAQVAAAAAEVVQQEGARLSEAERLAVTEYLKQVPPMIRRSMRRSADPEGRTIRPGATFRKPDDLLPLLPPQAPRFKQGDRPPGIGDWELVELLGRGGFGEVWKACNPHFDSVAPVALKFCLDPAAKDRLLKHEARIINQVMRQGRHDGIVPLLQSYLSADPPCLAYEYVAGGELTGLIQEQAQAGGMTPAAAARIIHRLGEIVGFAHGQTPPIVHRDLKPANILVQAHAGGEPKFRIADFGIGGLAIQQAKKESQYISRSAYRISAILGACTPLYASPQQMAGDDRLDPRDDVYALGVIWHQLLTGDLTKGRPGGDAWKKRLEQRGMTAPMLALLTAAFEEEREDRPAGGAVLAAELGRLVGGFPPPQGQVPVAEPIVVPIRTVPAAHVTTADLPPLPADILELEGQNVPNIQVAQEGASAQLRKQLQGDRKNGPVRRRYLSIRSDTDKGRDRCLSVENLAWPLLFLMLTVVPLGVGWILAGTDAPLGCASSTALSFLVGYAVITLRLWDRRDVERRWLYLGGGGVTIALLLGGVIGSYISSFSGAAVGVSVCAATPGVLWMGILFLCLIGFWIRWAKRDEYDDEEKLSEFLGSLAWTAWVSAYSLSVVVGGVAGVATHNLSAAVLTATVAAAVVYLLLMRRVSRLRAELGPLPWWDIASLNELRKEYLPKSVRKK